jgi:ABC-type molybdenum transport system ATPase subunit/photorepair protein PhrA
MRGAYMSARYESRKEETDFSLLDYLLGNTELNADETLVKHPDRALLDQVMVDLKLEALESMPVTNLSNGQTRRARIAKALLAKPELLLLDGPFMGLDPPTVRLLASILQKLAEAHAPRLILSLKPDEEFPHWVTHMAFLNRNFTVDSMGPRRDVVQGIHDRATKFVRGPRTDNISEEDLDLAEISRHLREKEPWAGDGWTDLTVEDSRLRNRDFRRKRMEKDGRLSIPDETAEMGSKFAENTLRWAPGEPKVFRSRDGFSGNPAPPPPPGEPLVEMKGVNVKYGHKSVLGNWTQEVDGEQKDGLWWNVCRGQRWGVFGPNGTQTACKN